MLKYMSTHTTSQSLFFEAILGWMQQNLVDTYLTQQHLHLTFLHLVTRIFPIYYLMTLVVSTDLTLRITLIEWNQYGELRYFDVNSNVIIISVLS